MIMMNPEDAPYPVSIIETTKLYDNKEQIAVAADIISFLNDISRRTENRIEDVDATRGALVAVTKFAVQTYYENNKRQFTEEHKKEIMNFVASILDTQLNQMNYAQVLAH